MPPTPDIPHGIRYSLTLHEPYGRRILGYDNAHGVKPPKHFKHSGKRYPFDHKHLGLSHNGVLFEFKDAQGLLVRFFDEVDALLAELRK